MNALFTALAGVFAVVPGIKVLRSGLGAPPQYGTLFGAVIEALGCLTLALLWANRSRLRQWSWPRVNRWVIGLMIAFAVSLTVYLFILNSCVITDARYSGQTVYYPLWLSGPAARMVAHAGSRSEAIARYGPSAVQDAVAALTTAQTATTALLLFLYQAVFTTLTAAFGIIGFHAGKELPPDGGGPPSS